MHAAHAQVEHEVAHEDEASASGGWTDTSQSVRWRLVDLSKYLKLKYDPRRKPKTNVTDR